MSPTDPVWDLPVSQAPFAFVDLEMTGLDPVRDRIVELCVERVVAGQCVDRLATLVCPPERAGGASHVHGLDEASLLGAPSFADLVVPLQRVLDGAIFVAHAAEWDVRFLTAELARVGVPFEVQAFVDTLPLARRAFVGPTHSLGALCTQLGIDRGRAHRAESDVTALRVLFDRCVDALAPSSARDLWEVRIGQHHARAAVLDACRKAIVEGPIQLVFRPCGRRPVTLLFVVVEVRSDLDPPKVIGYELPGRGRREIRADRILRVGPSAKTVLPSERA